MKLVYMAFQENEESGPVVASIIEDNPGATVRRYPAMVRIEAEGALTVKRESVERRLEREWDPQELHLYLISLAGNVSETDDEFTVSWGSAQAKGQ
ncbi:MAG TPA: MmoB/DmpM family protein [Noviherbaspirillum sp.]|uniref:MmoB/DmpM family protein n=1 Tax=Noviherbaspirillum sp. TaxID=1926288 RepID=UPI002B4877EA|nr:MmoB/DmpM family protein [Noviherbaspirillum sp.]HJV84980.1 MmoB/DmpM family protein [Noviherbaspirillum sp.]